MAPFAIFQDARHIGRAMSLERGDRALRRRFARLAVSVLLFAVGYAIANRFQLTHDVGYRLAAGDPWSAVIALSFLGARPRTLFRRCRGGHDGVRAGF